MTGIGGHIEDGEHNTPQESCFREILEETGITSSEIVNSNFVIFCFGKAEMKYVNILFILDIHQK